VKGDLFWVALLLCALPLTAAVWPLGLSVKRALHWVPSLTLLALILYACVTP
jgi:hypothetical protein